MFQMQIRNCNIQIVILNKYKQISLEEIQKMIQNSFSDLDDGEEEEMFNLTELESEEILPAKIIDEKIDANEMYHLHLDRILDGNDSDDKDKQVMLIGIQMM